MGGARLRQCVSRFVTGSLRSKFFTMRAIKLRATHRCADWPLPNRGSGRGARRVAIDGARTREKCVTEFRSEDHGEGERRKSIEVNRTVIFEIGSAANIKIHLSRYNKTKHLSKHLGSYYPREALNNAIKTVSALSLINLPDQLSHFFPPYYVWISQEFLSILFPPDSIDNARVCTHITRINESNFYISKEEEDGGGGGEGEEKKRKRRKKDDNNNNCYLI